MNAIATLALLVANPTALAEYQTEVIASSLLSPTGIAVRGAGPNTAVYFTQVPTPGVPGGMNSVNVLHKGSIRLISDGEPDPVNLAITNRGDLFWTCRTAGVILRMDARTGEVGLFLDGLAQPTGIATYRDVVYFTQVPTPGVPGGMNSVNAFADGMVHTLSMGEPEPADVVVDNQGTAYWTCKSAGVILQRTRHGQISLLRGMLNQPVGIALDASGRSLYFTEVPTPGVPGSMGGMNRVWRHDLRTGALELVDAGDPEPRDIAVAADGAVYWTCTSAGVIVRATRK